MRKYFVFLCICFCFISVQAVSAISSSNFAQSLTDEILACTDFYSKHGAFSYHRFLTASGKCYLSVKPSDQDSFVYRSLILTNKGILMVFNSYSEVEDYDSTGARVFYFFPRSQMPDIEENGDEIKLKLASDKVSLILSKTQQKILRAEGANIKEDPKVHNANKGGLEFSIVKTLYMDSGFAIGHDSTTNSKAKSKFTDYQGRTCTVKNSDVFNYTQDGDSIFKFSDEELKLFLAKKCPKLKINF